MKLFLKFNLFVLMIMFIESSDGQMIYNNLNFTEINNVENTTNVKPRPGFKKRRYGIHTFFLEGGYFFGYYTGNRYSINYDILLQANERSAFTFRIGYGMNNAIADSIITKPEPIIPIGINVLLGRLNQFELGAGGYYFRYRKVIPPYLSIGFRHQPPKGGFMYRIAVDIHLEHTYNSNGTEISKTAVYGPLLGLGWTF